MLGLLFIYFVGKAFYDLADDYDKSRWGFAILGIVSYYLGIFCGAFLIGIVASFFWPDAIDDSSSIVWGLVGIPIGILLCWVFYRLLKSKWSTSTQSSGESLDSDLKIDDPNH